MTNEPHSEIPAGHQGLRIEGDPARVRDAAVAIVDYRGDVTVTRRSTPEPVVGYVFDCTSDPSKPMQLRLMRQDGAGRVAIPVDDIASVEFTGRDTAAGKSFEGWIKRYVEKKRAGEAANIECDETPD